MVEYVGALLFHKTTQVRTVNMISENRLCFVIIVKFHRLSPDKTIKAMNTL
jgi:hypothetical protein